MDTAKWVKEARKFKGLTQEQLGDHLSVTKANVSHWEGGKHEPGINQLIAIKNVTGYPLLDNDVATPPENLRQALRLLGVAIAGTPDERTQAIAESLAGLAKDRGAEFRQRAVAALLAPDADDAQELGVSPVNDALTGYGSDPSIAEAPTPTPRRGSGKRASSA